MIKLKDVLIDDLLVVLRNNTYGLKALKTLIDALPSNTDIGDLSWDELLSEHTITGSTGKKLNDIPTTAMRGTDNAALATTLEDAMQKATASSYNQDTDSLEAISEAIDLIPTTAMRGTDNAALATVCTETRLAVLDTVIAEINANETKIDNINNYVDEVESMLKHGNYGLSALETKILNIENKDSAPYIETYPKLSASVNVVSGVAAWAEGSWTQIVPTDTINDTFWLVGVFWKPAAYESLLEIGTGASGSEFEIVNIPMEIIQATSAGYLPIFPINFSTKIKIAAGTRVSARIADSRTLPNTHKVKIIYATGV